MEVLVWHVLVEEQSGTGDGRQWQLTDMVPAGHDRAEAVRLAADMARQYQPRHPWSPRRRRLYRTSDDSWVVAVEGTTRTFHFRLSVAELVETIG